MLEPHHQRSDDWVPGKRTESPAQPSPISVTAKEARKDRVPGTEPGDALILYPGGHPQKPYI